MCWSCLSIPFYMHTIKQKHRGASFILILQLLRRCQFTDIFRVLVSRWLREDSLRDGAFPHAADIRP